MSNAEIYIETYKKLEETVRSVYRLKESDSISWHLRGMQEFQADAEEIKYCQEVRNLLQHRKKLGGGYPVSPSNEMIRFVEDLIERVRKRPKCMDICITFSGLYWATAQGSVRKVLQDMRTRGFTQVPILDKKRVIGVFDRTSLFDYLADQKGEGLSENLTFEDMMEYLALDRRKTEIFTFHPKDLYVDELQDVFEAQYRKGRRISSAFLTKTGKPSEPLIGMITPWDILGKAGN